MKPTSGVTIDSCSQLMKAIEVHIPDDNCVKDVPNERIMYIIEYKMKSFPTTYITKL